MTDLPPFRPGARAPARGWGRVLVGLCLLGIMGQLRAQPALSEPQVKALFLFNFAKYVDWPADAFASPESPLIIGLMGHSYCTEPLRRCVEGKKVSGRSIVVREVEAAAEAGQCHIIFASDSEKQHLPELLQQLRQKAVLTVSEADGFVEQGGMIGFVKRDGKVRLDINLNSARRARLEISSKLLSVADQVFGKQ